MVRLARDLVAGRRAACDRARNLPPCAVSPIPARFRCYEHAITRQGALPRSYLFHCLAALARRHKGVDFWSAADFTLRAASAPPGWTCRSALPTASAANRPDRHTAGGPLDSPRRGPNSGPGRFPRRAAGACVQGIGRLGSLDSGALGKRSAVSEADRSPFQPRGERRRYRGGSGARGLGRHGLGRVPDDFEKWAPAVRNKVLQSDKGRALLSELRGSFDSSGGETDV